MSEVVSDPGALVVVGTPIGNLGDLSARALDTLAVADVIACEDTRRTHALLTHAGIPAAGRLRAVPAHDEAARTPALVELIREGSRVAFVTDAGMPAISDPGAGLVRACLDAGLAVEIVPGPDAVTTALVLSGLPTDRFVFEGFLPRKGRARTERLATIATESRTVVIYESPRRVVATLQNLGDVCGGDRFAAMARELTKVHETVVRGTLAALLEELGDREVRGECVIVVAGCPDELRPAPTEGELDDALRVLLDRGASTRDAADAVSAQLGVARRVVYARAITLKR